MWVELILASADVRKVRCEGTGVSMRNVARDIHVTKKSYISQRGRWQRKKNHRNQMEEE